MEMFMKKLVFLMVFTILLFLLARMLEFIAWYETGLLMMKLVDPVSLSVKKMKSILDGRGLSYEGVVDKAELTDLVKTSGEVVEGEVLMMEQEQASEDEDTTTYFVSKACFDEEVEDKKDSVWLVQVIPRNHIPLLGRKAWTTVEEKLSRFGIRHGTFDCSIDPRICAQKNWNLPLLLLAMPQGHRHKDHVTMATFTSAGKAHQIIKWVDVQLASKVQIEMKSITDDVFWDKFDSSDRGLTVVLFSRSDKPPMFFSALNLKYSGRVKFVFVHIQDDADNGHTTGDRKQKYPSYFIVTPEHTKIYGSKPGEYSTYKAMDVYLHTLTPEANDIFVLSFIIVNTICFIGLFVIQGGMAKRICKFWWTIGKYNITFLILWLPLLGIIQLPCMSPVVAYSYKVIRLTAETWLFSKLREDWLAYSGHPYIIFTSFLLYCVAVNWVSKKLHRSTYDDRMTSAMWLRASLADFYRFLLRPSPALFHGAPRSEHLEEGLDLLIEQMAFPDLWLHPTIPTNYIQDLLTWRYSCEWLQSQSSSNEYDSSDTEKVCSICGSNKNRCRNLRQFIPTCRLGSKCKVGHDSCADKIQRNDFLRTGDGNDNFFEVRSQDKPVCHQPESLSRSDSENLITFGPDSKADSQRSTKRSEAQLTDKDSNLDTHMQHTNKKEMSDNNTVICLKCSQGGLDSIEAVNKEMNPETIGTCGMHSTDTKKSRGDSVPLQKKCSPKRHPKVARGRASPKKEETTDKWPEGILFHAQCAICLDSYTHGAIVCGLSCGHAYHKQCIVSWLTNGDHVCPICRWPAYKKKCKLSKHME